MTDGSHTQKSRTEFRDVLSRLRRKIRTYVWVEGVAVGIAWFFLTFWLALALDYIPVLFGMRELPWQPRAFILVVIGIVIAWIFYRWIFRRLVVKLRDRSLALLIERKFPQFNESLITSIEADGKSKLDTTIDPDMLEQTRRHAVGRISAIELNRVFNFRPLYVGVSAAMLLSVSIIVFGLVNFDAFQIASKRLYLLSDIAWPRQQAIDVVGVRISRENPVNGIDQIGSIVEFDGGTVRIAKGASLTLFVRAEIESSREPDRKLPRSCVLTYRTLAGQQGRQVLKKIGSPKNGFQLFSIDTAPFRNILSGIQFEVRGGDHRLGPLNIAVVEEPAIESMALHCEFPGYMVDASSNRWTPRVLDRWTNGMQLPQGTRIRVVARANKPIHQVYAFDISNPDSEMVAIDPDSDSEFEFEIASLEKQINLEFLVHDTDGVVAEQPHRLVIGTIEDQPPKVSASLHGIGSAITPDANIPIRGSIKDDYDVESAWVELSTSVTEPIEQSFLPDSSQRIDVNVDFRDRQRDPVNGFRLPAGPDSQVRLVVRSRDRFDLTQEPHVGSGDVFELDVVTPDRLLRILEQLEVGQRRRLEQVYQELTEARGYIVRTQQQTTLGVDAAEPGDALQDEPDHRRGLSPDDEEQLKSNETRLLFAQRAVLQIQKSTQELVGISREFHDIRLQLINNRVDSEDRKQQLQTQVIEPLVQLSGADLDDDSLNSGAPPNAAVEHHSFAMAVLEEKLVVLEEQLRMIASQVIVDGNQLLEINDEASRLTGESLKSMDRVLADIDAVLAMLVKYETQNELLDIVRRMIEIEKSIHERTRKERERQAFDDLLD